MVGFAETQKQLLFKIVDDGRSEKKNHLYQKLLYLTSFSAIWHSNTGIAASQGPSPSPLQPGLLWEAIGKGIICKAANEKKTEIKCSKELKSKACTEEPIKRMTGCPASALIFYFSKLSTHSMRALKIHLDPGFLDLSKFRQFFEGNHQNIKCYCLLLVSEC